MLLCNHSSYTKASLPCTGLQCSVRCVIDSNTSFVERYWAPEMFEISLWNYNPHKYLVQNWPTCFVFAYLFLNSLHLLVKLFRLNWPIVKWNEYHYKKCKTFFAVKQSMTGFFQVLKRTPCRYEKGSQMSKNNLGISRRYKLAMCCTWEGYTGFLQIAKASKRSMLVRRCEAICRQKMGVG